MDGQEIQKQAESKPKDTNTMKIIKIIVILFLLWLVGVWINDWILSLDTPRPKVTSDPVTFSPRDHARLEIEAVRNNSALSPSGRISFTIRNSGTYTFNATEASNIKIYIDGVDKTSLATCLGDIKEQGTTCAIDTEVVFPAVPGSKGAVEIKVEPSFGVGSRYNCAIPYIDSKTC